MVWFFDRTLMMIHTYNTEYNNNSNHNNNNNNHTTTTTQQMPFLWNDFFWQGTTTTTATAAYNNNNNNFYQNKDAAEALVVQTFHYKRSGVTTLSSLSSSSSPPRTTTGSTTMMINNIWDDNTNLPQWCKDYFVWHQQQMKFIHETWQPLFRSMMMTTMTTTKTHTNENENENADDAMRKYLWNQPDRYGTSQNYTSNDGESLLPILSYNRPQSQTAGKTKLRFMIVRCFTFDRKCGGLADRLLPLPYLLQVAYSTSRILLIHFERPAPLQHYLLPPQGGMDWRIPDWLLPAFNFSVHSRRYKAVTNLEWHAHNPNETIIQTIFQAYHYGSIPYNERRLQKTKEKEEPTFRQVVRDIWRTLFTPTPQIQSLIRQEMEYLGLVEGRYAAIHCRVLYAVQDRDPQQIRTVTQNALQCASELYQSVQGPFYIASDSTRSTQMAIEYARTIMVNITTTTTTTTTTAATASSSLTANNDASSWKEMIPIVVARSTTTATTTNNKNQNALHFDRIPLPDIDKSINNNQPFYQASDYYDTYVDLYLLAMSECVTHGIGGYGKLASYLSWNESCSSSHFKKKMRVCSWYNNNKMEGTTTTTTATATRIPGRKHNLQLYSLLSEPMT